MAPGPRRAAKRRTDGSGTPAGPPHQCRTGPPTEEFFGELTAEVLRRAGSGVSVVAADGIDGVRIDGIRLEWGPIQIGTLALQFPVLAAPHRAP